MEYHYEFGVYDITEEEAAALMIVIEAMVDVIDAWIGGGYAEATEATEDKPGNSAPGTEEWRNSGSRATA